MTTTTWQIETCNLLTTNGKYETHKSGTTAAMTTTKAANEVVATTNITMHYQPH